MAITVAQFRANFPMFSDTTRYPDQEVSFWLSVAGLMLNTGRWPTTPGANGQSLLDIGTSLFVAHNLTLDLQATQRGNLGGPPGVQVGALASVGANGASVSYNTTIGVDVNDGQYNLTVFGLRFIQLAKMIGAGPIQLGIGRPPPGYGLLASQAWAGIWVYNIPNPQL